MLAWMAYAMLAAAALGVAARLIDFAVEGRFVPRRALWAVVFFASAVGPIVFSVTRGISAAVVVEQDSGAAGAASGRSEPIVSDRVLGWAWLAASALFALWLVATQRRLRRRLLVCPSGIVEGERVLVSSDFGPAVVGVVRPQIVLPEWALAMREADRRIIVAHETEHRQAHDPLLAAMALIVAVALPWNAALWWQLRRLRLAIEIDCDRRVVSRHGNDPHAYGMLLLATRERASRVTPMMAMAMAAMRSGLGRRVEALVDGGSRSILTRLSALAAAVVIAGQIVSVPAPRLPMGLAAAVEASAADASLASSPTMPLRLVVFDSSVRAIVGPMPPAAVKSPRQGPRWIRQEDGSRRGGAGSTVEGYPSTSRVTQNRRVFVPSWAPNRAMLLPIGDSLPRRPR